MENPVHNMWEGMERFMKALDVIGRTCVELKEFQHSAEMTFERHQERIDSCVLQQEYGVGMHNL